MIFVILGSQMFHFNRLLQEIDRLIEKGIIKDKLIAQTGYSTYRPKYYEFKNFFNHEEFSENINQADFVITHGGTASIIMALKAGKKVIGVARLKQYHEHVDNHQIEIVRKFSDLRMIIGVVDVNQLEKAIISLNSHSQIMKPFVSNTSHITDLIEDFLKRKDLSKSLGANKSLQS